MSQNIGTLVTAAIRPNDSLDLIASAFANEIKGGLHSVTSSTDRDAIFDVRREWGMLCYVVNDNQTYQLEYNYASNDITDNANWNVFSGAGGGGGNEWVDSVLTILLSEPLSPSGGDRYLVGTKPTDPISGTNWSLNAGGFIAEYISGIGQWEYTFPTDNTCVRVDDEDNAIYRYEGVYPTGAWQKEKESQIRYISATSNNGVDYFATVEPVLDSYDVESIFITKFLSSNTGASVSLNINGLGDIIVKKVDGLSLTDIISGELSTNVQYPLTYDGTYFQLVSPGGANGLSVKYYLEATDNIVVPNNTQYWVYGDLTIDDGTLQNFGRVVIANGSLNLLNSGQFINSGTLSNIYFAEINGLGEINYVPKWVNPFLLTASSSIYDDGQTVEITSTTFSINSNLVYPTGASAGATLTSDSYGNATWQQGYSKYSMTQSWIGSTTYSIPHNLNSMDIVFNFWNEDTGELAIVSAVKTSPNTIDVNSSVSINNGKIVIIR